MEDLAVVNRPNWKAILRRRLPAENLFLVIKLNVFFIMDQPEALHLENARVCSPTAPVDIEIYRHRSESFLGERWIDGLFDLFKTKFLADANDLWDGGQAKIYLHNHSDRYDTTVSGTRYRPNIECRFTMEPVNSAREAHFVIHSLYTKIDIPRNPNLPTEIQDGYNFRSSVNRRSRLAYMSYIDIILSSSQNVAAHETGHMLGLSHVNACQWYNLFCSPNGDDEYGTTPEQQSDLMGGGNTISAWHAYPWQSAMQSLTSDSWNRWIPTTTRIAPIVALQSFTIPSSMDAGIAQSADAGVI